MCLVLFLSGIFSEDPTTGNLPGGTCGSNVFPTHVREMTAKELAWAGAELPRLYFREI